jgi:branched-chain amino acid transport system ATP-binding protein
MLNVSGLTVRYGGGPNIVEDICLDVGAGQLSCIIGPNGAGKSTLLAALFGLLRPRTGKVVLDGTDITSMPPHARLRLGLALVPQGRSVFPEMTVHENLLIGGYVIADQRRLGNRLEHVLQTFPHLGSALGQRAGTLSGGEQQMLVIARALMLTPRVVLFDEPSLGLAPRVAAAMFRKISDLRADGLTVVLVEQNARMGLAIADRGIVLHDGRKVIEDRAERILSNPAVAEVYLGGRPRANSS